MSKPDHAWAPKAPVHKQGAIPIRSRRRWWIRSREASRLFSPRVFFNSLTNDRGGGNDAWGKESRGWCSSVSMITKQSRDCLPLGNVRGCGFGLRLRIKLSLNKSGRQRRRRQRTDPQVTNHARERHFLHFYTAEPSRSYPV